MGSGGPTAGWIAGEQPHRVVPERRRPSGFPYDEHPEIEAPGRAFPCGRHDGGYLYGPASECRDADVRLEDWVGPPLYTERQRDTPRTKMIVESTHTETRLTGLTSDGRSFIVGTTEHPGGLR